MLVLPHLYGLPSLCFQDIRLIRPLPRNSQEGLPCDIEITGEEAQENEMRIGVHSKEHCVSEILRLRLRMTRCLGPNHFPTGSPFVTQRPILLVLQ
jgi:hypothetical protein